MSEQFPLGTGPYTESENELANVMHEMYRDQPDYAEELALGMVALRRIQEQ